MKMHLTTNTIIVLLTFLHISHSFSYNHSLIINKANYVAESSYVKHLTTSVVWGRADPEIISSFLHKYKGTVVLVPLLNKNEYNIKNIIKEIGCKQTIFFVTDTKEFEYFTKLLYEVLIYPIRLILIVTEEISKAELECITSTAWAHDLPDIVILNKNMEGKVKMSTYFPYSGRVCGDSTPVDVTQIDSNLFQNKFSNFYGCPIKMSFHKLSPYVEYAIANDSTVTLGGIDGDIFTRVKEKLNASINVISYNEQSGIGTVINGTATGMFANLVNKRADTILPLGLLDHMRYPVTQVTHVQKTVTLIWVGPPRRKVPQWLRIVLPIMTKFTPALIITFITFIVCILLVKRCPWHTVPSNRNLIFETFVIFLDQGDNYGTKSWLLNSLFVMWIWFCMIIRIIYQGNLVDGLQRTILEKPLNTFEEAADILDEFVGAVVLREFYRGTKYFSRYKQIRPDLNQEFLKNISTGRNAMIIVEPISGFQVDMNLQIIGSPLVNAPAGVYMRPGWAAFENIDRILLQLLEMGYIDKLYKDFKKGGNVHNIKNRNASPLDRDTLIGCFYGLGIMYCVCFIVFLLEVVYDRLKNNLS